MNRLGTRRSASGLGFLLAAALAGCAGRETLTPSPSYPTLGKSRTTRHGYSGLVVMTETWLDPNIGSGDDGAVRRPTGYTLFDEQGLEIQRVRNYIGALDSEPTVLDMDPGRYLIRLDRPWSAPPVFWVVIEPGRVTEVDVRKK